MAKLPRIKSTREGLIPSWAIVRALAASAANVRRKAGAHTTAKGARGYERNPKHRSNAEGA